MEIYVLNQSFEKIGVIDDYESVIWTTRYYEPGDFEIKIPAGSQNIGLLEKDNYLIRYDDETVMIIERLNIITDIENGNFILASGRCLKSILDRRVIWKLQKYSGTPENCIRNVLTRNIISPAESARKISNFTLGPVGGFTGSIEAQYTGTNVLDVVIEICKAVGLGFKILLENGQFEFVLYNGADRSYKQDVNLPVIFSPDNDNIINTDYTEEKTYYKNVALVAGEGEGLERKYNTTGAATGLQRRELFVDANDIKTEVENEAGTKTTLTTAQYNAALSQRGAEKLAEVAITQTFEGSVDTEVLYKFKEDFFLGDIVTAVNEYGIKAAPRITEIIESEDEAGYSVIPTFDGWEQEVE